MARLNDLPFQRGTTFFNGATPNTTDGAWLEGKEYLIEDVAEMGTGGYAGNGTNSYVRLRCVRNLAPFVLTGKRLIEMIAGKPGQTDGYAFVNPQQVLGVVDDYYAFAGQTVPVNDLFWAVVQGPCLVKTSLAGDITNSIAAFDFLVNTTGATSGATTAGRAADIALSAATTVSPSVSLIQALNVFGRALSAKTTTQTDNDLLVFVGTDF